jgi:hypothetical protein
MTGIVVNWPGNGCKSVFPTYSEKDGSGGKEKSKGQIYSEKNGSIKVLSQ